MTPSFSTEQWQAAANVARQAAIDYVKDPARLTDREIVQAGMLTVDARVPKPDRPHMLESARHQASGLYQMYMSVHLGNVVRTKNYDAVLERIRELTTLNAEQAPPRPGHDQGDHIAERKIILAGFSAFFAHLGLDLPALLQEKGRSK